MARAKLVAGKLPGHATLTRGPSDAKVTATLFCSLQSRNCARLGATLEEVRKIYGDKVEIAFRHLFDDTDTSQPGARLAHEAALCAHEQGAFWRFYDQQVNQLRWASRVAPLSMGQLRSRAKLAQLDVEDFTRCVESARYAKTVEREVRAARKAGITKTPSLVIGGRLYVGTKSQNELMYLIRRQLRPGLLERWAPASVWDK
jgi:protein-disulfide isomerase